MNDWIVLRHNELPPDDDLYLVTLEHSDGGRSVKFCRVEDLWAGLRIVAYMPVQIPEPFGGECLPIDPVDLRKCIVSGYSVRQMAAHFKMNYQRFHATIRRYAVLKTIWDER